MIAPAQGSPLFLVTGATGFLGRRLVVRLLREYPEAGVIAMGRKDDPQLDQAADYVSQRCLETQPEASQADLEQRLTWCAGDITRPNLGLDDAQVADIARGADLHIVHLAAIYDLDVEERLSKALNLDGAIHAYELALRIRRHPEHGDRAVRMCHTSTLAAAGTYTGEFGETGEELAPAEGTHTDWYSRHKHQSERALHEREQPEVPLMIVRPGIAVGDSDTGAIEKLDGPYVLLEYLRWPLAGHAMPSGSDDPIWIVPGDFVVRAMASLGGDPDAYGHTFNLLYPPEQVPTWRDLAGHTVEVLRSRPYTGGGLAGLRAALRYGWGVSLSVRRIIRLCERPWLGPVVQRVFAGMGVSWHALYYAVDNPRYVVENYQRFGVEPPPPWRDVWRACVLYYRDHRSEMLGGARIAHQKDR